MGSCKKKHEQSEKYFVKKKKIYGKQFNDLPVEENSETN